MEKYIRQSKNTYAEKIHTLKKYIRGKHTYAASEIHTQNMPQKYIRSKTTYVAEIHTRVCCEKKQSLSFSECHFSDLK